MSDPVTLKPGFHTGVVSMLTELLRRAVAGEIDQMALVFTEPGSDGYGTWISDGVGHGATLRLIGAVADLQYNILRAYNEQQP